MSAYIAKGNPSGLTDEEAKDFHKIFNTSAIVFVGVAVVAHILVWSWRPWFPPVGGYTTSALDTVQQIIGSLV